MSLKDHLANVATAVVQNPKGGASVAAATTAAGGFLDRFPEQDLAKIATMMGIVLTTLLIVVHSIKLYSLVRLALKRRSRDTKD